ncbi:bifunctional glycosyltransferase/CDP-glycerol:glycerophosphate glycerophosphotransferase [Roseicitreum antarcticum]|uniref:Glycosyl transferase family 2 n=1 Tax=Roseicitreum antarcticum TaxID=564137 RepID=A0A1H3CQF6_9RHOB|nr:glycosyltransferase family 2 protein [Roseicitreum antarcticum]SDX56345.1 Glycosyl transferase family 2 [Roseicitreum antarcticum]
MMDIEETLASISEDFSLTVWPRSLDAILISVIIPCHNSAEFIVPCLESLAAQTLPQTAFEVICVDDCSSDETVSVIDTYKGKIANLKLMRHLENKKQGAARNTGIDAARGQFVTFVDSDDFLRVDMLEMMLHIIGDTEVAVCQHIHTRYDKPYKRTSSNRHVKTTLSLAALEGTIGWWPFGMLISRQLLNSKAIRFREGVYFEDIDFNIRVCMNATSHTITKEALYHYTERDSSTVNSIDEKKLLDSVDAIVTAWEMSASLATSGDQDAFLRKSASWLMLQAQRLRNSSDNSEKKAGLARTLVNRLKAHGLMDRFEAELGDNIMKCASEPPPATAAATTQKAPADFRYTPWPMDLRSDFLNKVIFFCEVNYHIRSSAPVARHLRSLGIDSVIVDASRSTSFTSNRPLPDVEMPQYADLDLRSFDVAKVLPFSTDAAAFVFMNDLTYTKRLIFENFGFGVPTFGFYEGINDDWNLDRISSRKPYRSVDHLLLPGIYQKAFYQDRKCTVVGLPNVRSRLAQEFVPARLRRAVINVNFTYGVLEDRRNDFVESAVQACQEIGLDYVITQHPADKADLSRFNVSAKSVYDLLDEGSVLISRFSTTILEALAMGRPVVYHNPIDEKVPKFHQPLGAYRTSGTIAELKSALEHELGFQERGGNVRSRAALFLHFHCNTGLPDDPAERAARAIAAVLAVPQHRLAFKAGDGMTRTVPPLAVAAELLGKGTSPLPAVHDTAHSDVSDLPNLATRLLLNPAGLPRVEPGGDLHAAAETLIGRGDPAAAHFIKVRDWARAKGTQRVAS